MSMRALEQKMLPVVLITLAVAVAGSVGQAEAGACRDRVQGFVDERVTVPRVCAGFNPAAVVQSVQDGDSEYSYNNPEVAHVEAMAESCGSGLEFPGLPKVGGDLDVGGFDSCEILQSITGDYVSSINDKVRDFLSSYGISGSGGVNFTDQILDAIKR